MHKIKNIFRNNRGFTLTELMVVITIIGILSAVAFPNLMDMKRDNNLYSEARKLKSYFRYTQQLASDTSKNCSIEFDADGSGYTIYHGVTQDLTVKMVRGITFDSEASNGDINILRNGTLDSTDPALIVLKSRDGTQVYVKIGLGGKVDITWEP